LEHLPRKDHAAVLRRINQWLKPEGLVLISVEAGDYDDVMNECLGVPMFISCYEPKIMKQMVVEAGFGLIETEIVTQLEGDIEIPFQWILARKK